MENQDHYSSLVKTLDSILESISNFKRDLITGEIPLEEVQGVFLQLDYSNRITQSVWGNNGTFIRLIALLLEKCPELSPYIQEYLDNLNNKRVTEYNLN